MLESAEIGDRVAKGVYAREEPRLREALLLKTIVHGIESSLDR